MHNPFVSGTGARCVVCPIRFSLLGFRKPFSWQRRLVHHMSAAGWLKIVILGTVSTRNKVCGQAVLSRLETQQFFGCHSLSARIEDAGITIERSWEHVFHLQCPDTWWRKHVKEISQFQNSRKNKRKKPTPAREEESPRKGGRPQGARRLGPK